MKCAAESSGVYVCGCGKKEKEATDISPPPVFPPPHRPQKEKQISTTRRIESGKSTKRKVKTSARDCARFWIFVVLWVVSLADQ